MRDPQHVSCSSKSIIHYQFDLKGHIPVVDPGGARDISFPLGPISLIVMQF